MLRRRADGRALRVGHRGAPTVASGNTLRSVAAAIEAGVDVVEVDVLALGGELLLGHSLRELPVERTRFDEALATFAASGVGVHVDVKARGIEQPIAAALRRHRLEDRTFVSTPWADVLRRFAVAAPWLPRALTYPEDRLGVSRRRAFGPVRIAGAAALRRALPRRILGLLAHAEATIASLHVAVVSRAVVERCHAAGVPIIVWTVDDPAVVRRLDRLGVEAIVSNDPEMLAATLRT